MALVSDLKDRIFKNTSHKYTDTFHMLDLINDGLNNLVDSGRLRTSTTISVIADTNNYALPANFKAPYLLQDETDPNTIVVYPLVSISENAPGYAIEDQIYLKPKPNTNTTLKLYYYKYATELTADDGTPEIDSQYHDLLATYATAMIMLIPELNYDKGAADRWMNAWETGKMGFVKAMTQKNRLSRVREKVVW